MDWAKAMKYGGHPVLACDCSYDDHKNLILRCPACGEAVFLVKEHYKHQNAQEIFVPAHFSHHKLPGEQPKDCEKRVKNISKSDREKLANVARNQRLKDLQKYFWQIYCRRAPILKIWSMDEIEAGKFDLAEIHISLTHQQKQIAWQRIVEGIANSLRASKNTDAILAYLERDIEDFLVNPLNFQGKYAEEVLDLRTKLDLALHKMVCQEAIDFLKTQSGMPILNKLITIAWFAIMKDDRCQPRNQKEMIVEILKRIIVQVAMIPWYLELGNKQQSSQTRSNFKGFAVTNR